MTKNTKLWKDDIPHAVLQNITDFAVEKPHQLVDQVGRISARFREVALKNSTDLWGAFYYQLRLKCMPVSTQEAEELQCEFSEFSDEGDDEQPKILEAQKKKNPFKKEIMSAPRNTSNAYFKYAKALKEAQFPNGGNQELVRDIENCNSDFSFLCPVLESNIFTLDELDKETGLPLMYCDICKKNLFPVTSAEMFEKRGGQEGRCVYFSQEAQMFMDDVKEEDLFNFAIVVRKNSSSSVDYRSIVHDVLSHSSQWLQLRGTDIEVSPKKANAEKEEDQTDHFYFNIGVGVNFPSKNEATARLHGISKNQLHIKLVEVSDEESANDDLFSEALDKAAPKKNGWAYVFLMPGASKNGTAAKGKPGTQFHVLQAVDRVVEIQADYLKKSESSNSAQVGVDLGDKIWKAVLATASRKAPLKNRGKRKAPSHSAISAKSVSSYKPRVTYRFLERADELNASISQIKELEGVFAVVDGKKANSSGTQSATTAASAS